MASLPEVFCRGEWQGPCRAVNVSGTGYYTKGATCECPLWGTATCPTEALHSMTLEVEAPGAFTRWRCGGTSRSTCHRHLGRCARRAPSRPRPSPHPQRQLSCTELPLRSPEGLLVVVELDVRLVEQRNVEVEREVAVGALHEREGGVPAMQVARQLDVMLGELPRREIVARVPRQRPVGRRAERHREPHLLGARAGGRRPPATP